MNARDRRRLARLPEDLKRILQALPAGSQVLSFVPTGHNWQATVLIAGTPVHLESEYGCINSWMGSGESWRLLLQLVKPGFWWSYRRIAEAILKGIP